MSVAQYENYPSLKTLKAFRKKFPNHYGILFELGRYYLYSDVKKALNFLFQSRDQGGSEDQEVYLTIAKLYYNQRKYARAVIYFEIAENYGAFSLDYVHMAAWSFQEAERYEKAVAYYEQYLVEFPDEVDALINLGFCYGHLDQIEKALRYSLKAVQLSPKHEVALLNTGFHFWIEKDLAKAHAYTETLLKINPTYDYALMNMGHIYFCKNSLEKALDCYRKSILEFEDEKEFVRLFEDDYKYMAAYGVSKEAYWQIRDGIIEYRRSRNKS